MLPTKIETNRRKYGLNAWRMTVEPVRQRKGRWGGEGREMQRLGQKKIRELEERARSPAVHSEQDETNLLPRIALARSHAKNNSPKFSTEIRKMANTSPTFCQMNFFCSPLETKRLFSSPSKALTIVSFFFVSISRKS